MGFVGIQTGFGSAGRQGALRRTWFPSDHKRLEESTGLSFRFVIGRTSYVLKMSELKKEVAKYERLSHLLGKEYFLHAYGPIYALSADVVSSLVALRNNSFRMFSIEDVTIGSGMLAMHVSNEDNYKICVAECTPSSMAVWDIRKCSELCNTEKKVLELHSKNICSKSSTLSDDDEYQA